MSRWTVRTGTVAGTDHGSCSVAWIGRARGAAVAWPRNGPKGPFPPPERASESTVLDRQRRPNGRGALALVGGAFAGIFVATVESTIREGRGGMPAFGERLAGEEIADVVAYLEALPAATDIPGERTGPGQMTERMTEHVMWVGMAGGGWVAMLLWIVFSIALLVLVVVSVVWLVGSLGSGRGGSAQRTAGSPGSGSPQEILDHRYACGEISREQYLRVRRDLEGPGDGGMTGPPGALLGGWPRLIPASPTIFGLGAGHRPAHRAAFRPRPSRPFGPSAPGPLRGSSGKDANAAGVAPTSVAVTRCGGYVRSPG